MYWIHSLVGVSHFAKYYKNQPVTDCVRYTNKSPKLSYSTVEREKWKSGAETVSGTGSPPKVSRF